LNFIRTFEKETGMRQLVPRFPGFFSKILEMAGAGLASAIGAFLLSQIVSRPPAPATLEPQMVQIVPAAAEVLSIVRSDQAALLAELQKFAPAEPVAPASIAPMSARIPVPVPSPKAVAAIAPKPAKTATAAVVRQEPKADPARPVATSYKTIADEPLSIQPTSAAPTAASQPAPAAGAEGGRVFSTLKQIPSWFLPDSERLFGDAPRPPMPVGQLLSSAM
jgi:hypothetical protein